MDAVNISDRVSELMKEADKVKFIDYKSRSRVMRKFFELRHLLLLTGV